MTRVWGWRSIYNVWTIALTNRFILLKSIEEGFHIFFILELWRQIDAGRVQAGLEERPMDCASTHHGHEPGRAEELVKVRRLPICDFVFERFVYI